MTRITTSAVGILNFFVFLFSIPILASGLWMATMHGTDCEKFLEGPVILLGVFIMLVSLLGLLGACFRVSWLLWIYLFVTFLVILVLFAFTVLAFMVTNKDAAEIAAGKGYKHYRLSDYSHWLQHNVESPQNWEHIKNCIMEAKVCKTNDSHGGFTHLVSMFYDNNLSSIENGCCKAPKKCHNNETQTISLDCATWKEDVDVLCYSCSSCKEGVIKSIKHNWRKMAAVNIVVIVFLIAVYSVGCCAFRNHGNSHGRKGKGFYQP